MEPGDFFGHGVHDGGVGLAPGKQNFEHSVQGQFFHEHGVFHDVRCSAERQPSCNVVPDGHDIQVNTRRQAFVQPQFFFAVKFSLFERCEIKEPEIDRFFDLIHVLAGDEDVRNVRLHNFNFLGPVRIKIRTGHLFDNAGMNHEYLKKTDPPKVDYLVSLKKSSTFLKLSSTRLLKSSQPFL